MKIQRKNKRKEMASIRLEAYQLNWCIETADANGLTKSDVIRQMIDWAMKKQIGFKKKTQAKTA